VFFATILKGSLSCSFLTVHFLVGMTKTSSTFIVAFFLLVLQTNANGIRGKILATPGTPVKLMSYRLHISDSLASSFTNDDSIFKIPVPEPAYHGFYRLVWGNQMLDILYDGESISFEQSADGEIHIIRGENWRNYRNQRNELIRLRENRRLLEQINDRYQGESKIRKLASKESKKLAKQERKLLRIVNQQPGSLANRYLRYEAPFVGKSETELDSFFTRERYLALVDLSDTVQMHYNLLPQQIITYYRLFEPMTGEDPEIQIISFVNRVFDKLEENPAYLNPVADFVRIGLEQMNQPKALHLFGQRLAMQNACNNPVFNHPANVQAKKKKAIQPGDQAVKIKGLLSAKGDTVDVQPAAGLIIFWSAECPTSLQQLPDLHLWLKNNRSNMEVTAISLDTHENGWKSEIQHLEHFKHFRQPGGWVGSVADAYFIPATPYYVLIDSSVKIINSYRAVTALREALEKK
jgi:hypothetical protein